MNWKMSAEFAQPFQIRRVHRNSPQCECAKHRLEPWVFCTELQMACWQTQTLNRALLSAVHEQKC